MPEAARMVRMPLMLQLAAALAASCSCFYFAEMESVATTAALLLSAG